MILYFSNSDKISKIDISLTNPVVIDVVSSSAYGLEFKGDDLYFSNSGKIFKIDTKSVSPTPIIVSETGGGYRFIYNEDIFLFYSFFRKQNL